MTNRSHIYRFLSELSTSYPLTTPNRNIGNPHKYGFTNTLGVHLGSTTRAPTNSNLLLPTHNSSLRPSPLNTKLLLPARSATSVYTNPSERTRNTIDTHATNTQKPTAGAIRKRTRTTFARRNLRTFGLSPLFSPTCEGKEIPLLQQLDLCRMRQRMVRRRK